MIVEGRMGAGGGRRGEGRRSVLDTDRHEVRWYFGSRVFGESSTVPEQSSWKAESVGR